MSRLALLVSFALAVGASACGLEELIVEFGKGGSGGAGTGGSAQGGQGGHAGQGGTVCAIETVQFAERASFTTQETEPEEILSLTLPEADNGWIVLLSARITSETIQAHSQEVTYLIDGVERGTGQSRSENGAPGGGGPWQAFDFIAPKPGERVVSVEFRSTRDQFLATIEDLHVVAFAVPDGANLVFIEEPELQTIMQPTTTARIYQTVLSLDIAAGRPGDYLVMLGVVANELPGIASVGIRVVAPGADIWPVESVILPRPYLATAIDDDQSFMLMRSIPSDGTAMTVDLQVDGSGTEGSQVQYARALAIRHDAFAAVNGAAQLDEQAITGDTVVAELDLGATDPCHRRVVAQFLSMHGEGSRSALFVGADAMFNHLETISESKLSYGSFAVLSPEAATLTNSASTSDPMLPLQVRESVIVALELPGMY